MLAQNTKGDAWTRPPEPAVTWRRVATALFPSHGLRELSQHARPCARVARLLEDVERGPDAARGSDAQPPRGRAADQIVAVEQQDRPCGRFGLHVDGVLRTVVHVKVEPQRAGGRAARPVDYEHAWQIEPLLHQPALRLPLHRRPFGDRPLRDEKGFPPMAQRHFMNAPHRVRVERRESLPEVGYLPDRMPDGVAPAL